MYLFSKLFCSIIRNLHLTLCPRVYMYLNIDDIHNLAYTPCFLTIQRFKVVYINGYIDVLYTWSFVSFQCFIDWVFPFMSPRGFVPLSFYMIVQQKINIDRNENQARGNIRGRVILFWNKDIPLYYMQSTCNWLIHFFRPLHIEKMNATCRKVHFSVRSKKV